MSAIRIVEHYPYPAAQVWRALTDPELIPRWTVTGAGARPVGFDTTVGTEFQFVAKPKPGWDGVVNCVLLEAVEPTLLRFSWTDNGGGDVTEVVYRLTPDAGGTSLLYEHTGFTGIGGFVMARLLGRIRRRMLRVGLPPVLAELGQP
ncbi:MAG: SRPBCC domain-containing protein [Catenulispora sp.]|nr:SRPBCC domain-containing protein [Catenulispora sp.]